MKNLLLIIFLLSSSVFAREDDNPDFHRLLIFNENNELMVVKIKNTDYWVTQGLYSKNKKNINKELHDQAAEYGLRITTPDLRGTFTLKNRDKYLTRHFYKVKVIDGTLKSPDNIEEIMWLPIDKAMERITFPHINVILGQIMKHPETVWSGTVERYKKNGQLKSKVIKDFTQLNNH